MFQSNGSQERERERERTSEWRSRVVGEKETERGVKDPHAHN